MDIDTPNQQPEHESELGEGSRKQQYGFNRTIRNEKMHRNRQQSAKHLNQKQNTEYSGNKI